MTIRRYPEYIRSISGGFFVSAESLLQHGSYSMAFAIHAAPPSTGSMSDPKVWEMMRGMAEIARITGGGAFATRYQAILKGVMARVAEDKGLQALLQNQPVWDRTQRMQWEARLAQIVSEEHAKDPLLGNYRGGPRSQNQDDPASDPSAAYLCRHMAATEAMLLQQVEQQVLGANPGGGFKQPGQYFIASGEVAFNRDNAGDHRWIVSPLGNVIESTHTTDRTSAPYHAHLNPGHTADAVFAGYPTPTLPVRTEVLPDGQIRLSYVSGQVATYNAGHDGSSHGAMEASRRFQLLRAGAFADPLIAGGNALIGSGDAVVTAAQRAAGVTTTTARLSMAATETCATDCSWDTISERLRVAGLPAEPEAEVGGNAGSRLPAGAGKAGKAEGATR